MKRYTIAVLLVLIVSACGKTPINGDLDGRWQIIKIEYYKITSITNWIFVFFQFFCIRCAYITYIANAEEVTKLIGCLSYKEIKEIVQKTNIKLKVH